MKEHAFLNYITVRSRVLTAKHQPVNKLEVSKNYLHGIAFGENLSLWPVELVVTNDIPQVDQVRYLATGAPERWSLSVSLPPDYGAGEQYALMECFQKTSGRTEVRTSLRSNEYEDNFCLEMELE